MTKTTKVWSIDVFEIREIIRLYYVETFNRNQIALALKKSFSTITSIIARLESSGVAPEVLAQMSDTELRSVVYPKPPGPKDEPTRVHLDLEYLSGELQRKGVTRQLLWHEYCDNNPEGTYSYSRFCEHLRSYMQQSQLSMVLDHPPGERAYCDYAGDTVPIYDYDDTVSFKAQIFVVTLAYSEYSYVCAHRSQDMASFSMGCAQALMFYGGSPKILTPDNLKAGVLSHTTSQLVLSRGSLELGAHFQLAILPTRVRRPKDKASCEARVGFVQRNLLAAARDHKFHSIEALNAYLLKGTERINQLPFTKKPGSRAELFEEERMTLQPLPLLPFSYGEWKTMKVPPNYHITIQAVLYSVPCTLRGHVVEVKITDREITVFSNAEIVAHHERCFTPGSKVTIETHLHPHHRSYLQSQSKDAMIGRAMTLGPSVGLVAREILAGPVTSIALASLDRMLRLSDRFGTEELERACSYGLSLGMTSRASIAAIVEAKAYDHNVSYATAAPLHENLRSHEYFNDLGHSDQGYSDQDHSTELDIHADDGVQ